MSIDLSTMDRKDLEKLRKDIDKQIERLNKSDQKAALEAAERAAREHGFSLAELTGGASAKAGRVKTVNPPRYRNPDNPSQTWTGKGRRPDWIKAAQEKGEDLSKFEIA
ncbi:H-NS family nucleoid-associated regulatory protein [Histidinibacterium lentulum]|uniref:H-NS histone family protein n=1 Tax=Histidinibacterium lentulum TaxID=2480588 RepID=A0A3N2R101_9RHOB|nr:H-NS histone family protein [Histidinibacterium lentulum]ROU01142.1 H-NS histone family protein [Histidinibacterium lentulum]